MALRLVNQLPVFALLIFVTFNTVKGGVCPAGWYKKFDYCYYVSQPSEATTWDLAKDACQALGAGLVSLENQAENDYIFSLSSSATQRNTWIGFRQVYGSIWRWQDASSSLWTLWDTEEPDDDGKCARMSINAGKWRDRSCTKNYEFVCKRLQDCASTPTVQYATPDTNATTSLVGTVVTFTCDYGFEYADESFAKTSTCEVGGTWTSMPNCGRRQCPAIPAFNYVDFNDTNNEVDSVVSFKCIANYWFSFYEANITKVARCDAATKAWTNNFTECEEISCIRPITSFATASSPMNTAGTVVTYDCDLGFIFPDNTSSKDFTCQKNGGWSPPPLPCEIKQCPYSNVTHAIPSTTKRYFDTTVTWSCEPGHEYADSTILKRMYCTPAGVWSPAALPDCFPISCGPSPNVTNAVRDTNATIYPTVVNYTCLENHYFIDGASWRTVECDGYGEWSGSPTPCLGYRIKINNHVERPPTESESAVTFGTLAMVFVVVFFVSMVGFDIFTFKMHYPTLKRNLPCLHDKEEDVDLEQNDEAEPEKEKVEKKNKKKTKADDAASQPANSRPSSRASSAWIENEKAGSSVKVKDVDVTAETSSVDKTDDGGDIGEKETSNENADDPDKDKESLKDDALEVVDTDTPDTQL